MTFVKVSKRKAPTIGLESVFDFQWHPLKNKTHIITDFIPTWDVQFGKIQKLTVEQMLEQTKKDFFVMNKAFWDSLQLPDYSTTHLVTVVITSHYTCNTIVGQQ